MRFLLLSLFATVIPLSVQAQDYDLATIDGTIDALYDVISGPEGFEIDRSVFDPLFMDDARLSATYTSQSGEQGFVSWTPAEYVEAVWSGPRERGFFEIELYKTVEQFGNVVHAFSTYESRWNEDDEEPFQRGINSIQLLKRTDRYYIVSILWQGETPDTPIPAEYLP